MERERERERERLSHFVELEVELYFSSISKPKGGGGYLINLASLGGVI